MRMLFILLSLCIASMAYGQSKEPPKEPKKTENPCADPCSYQIAPPGGPITINVSPSQTLNSGPGEKSDDQHSKSEWEKWIAIWTGVLALATFGLAGVALRQKFAMDESSRRQLRAYVGISYPELIIRTGDSSLLAILSYSNSGQTPAHDVEVRMDGKIVPCDQRPMWEPPNRASDEGKGGVLLPDVTWDRTAPIDLRGVPLSEIVQSMEGTIKKNRVWVWGTISYKDAFDEPCFVKFRFWSGDRKASSKKIDGEEFINLIPDLEHSKGYFGKSAVRKRHDTNQQ